MSERLTVRDNQEARQYEVDLEGGMARVEYIKAGNRIYLTHTEVPKAFEGQGIARRLVHQVLENVQEQELSLIPLCPYVAAFIQRNPEWKTLLSDGVNV